MLQERLFKHHPTLKKAAARQREGGTTQFTSSRRTLTSLENLWSQRPVEGQTIRLKWIKLPNLPSCASCR